SSTSTATASTIPMSASAVCASNIPMMPTSSSAAGTSCDSQEAAVARYRLRTRIRQLLPFALIGLAPKGKTDCGDHEWYRSTDEVYRCYHCIVGIRHDPPER